MSCRIHSEIDLPRYLLDPSDGEFDAFRAHYPTCPECAREVLAWTSIEQALAHPSAEVGGPPTAWHPEPEALARYAGRPGPPGSEVEAMHRHIESCPTCRTEWRSLEHFDFVAAMEPSPSAGSVATAAGDGGGWLGRLLAGLGLDTPARAALAGALVMTGLLLFAWLLLAPERRDAREVERFAERAVPSPASQDAPAPMRPAPIGSAPEVVPTASGPGAEPAAAERLLAEAPAPSRERSPAPSTEPSPAPSPAPSSPAPTPAPALAQAAMPETAPAEAVAQPRVQLAQATKGGDGGASVVPAVSERAGEERPGAPAAVNDDVLLASLAEMPPPDYTAPAGATQLAWLHQFGSVRSSSRGPDAANVQAHAPDHVGLTRLAAPRLWWSLGSPALQPVTITVVDDREIDPVLEVEIEGPHAPGVHAIALADHGIELEPGVEYRWFVTLVVDAERPSRNPISAGSIKRVPAVGEVEAAIEAADAAELGHALARQGYWYDAYDFFAALSARHPDVAALGDHRDRLLADSNVAP